MLFGLLVIIYEKFCVKIVFSCFSMIDNIRKNELKENYFWLKKNFIAYF